MSREYVILALSAVQSSTENMEVSAYFRIFPGPDSERLQILQKVRKRQ